MTLTPWFGKGILPAREGWYQTKFDWDEESKDAFPSYSYWDGYSWSRSFPSIVDKEGISKGSQHKMWRGVFRETTKTKLERALGLMYTGE